MVGLGDFTLGGIPLTPISSLFLFIKDVNYLGKVHVKNGDSLELGFDLAQRATLKFELVDKTGTYAANVGEQIRFYLGGSGALAPDFAGTIERLEKGTVATGVDTFSMVVECVDHSEVLDRRLVAANYETPGQTAGDIASDIINDLNDTATSLAPEGLSLGTIDPGVEVTKAIFPYVTAANAINDLANLTGVTWWVDSQRRLNFVERTSILPPFSITDAFQPFKDMKQVMGREQTKNRIYLIAGQAQTDPQSESFAGDTKRKTFTVAFPIALAPTISLKPGGGPAVAKTVGIRNVDTGKDWYWQKDSNEISQDDGASKLGTSDELVVAYVGHFPLVLTGDEVSSQTELAAIGQNSGLYESLEQDEDIDDRNVAVTKLQTLLKKFAHIEDRVSFTTFSRGLMTGMVLPITLTDERIDGKYLIESIQVGIDLRPVGALVTTRVTGVGGEFIGGWLEFFRMLEKRGKKFVIRENDILALGPTSFEHLELTDSYSTATALDDGTNDPYTGLRVVGDADPTEMKRSIDRVCIGGPSVQNITG